MTSGISGFPEFLPQEQIAFDRMLGVIRKCFESYGFSPLDTPAVERVSTILSKAGDNEIYGIYRLGDENGKKDLALRFDLTVPLARYVAQHYGELVFPYRRYHIAPVWRGERAQAGRYRQFYQCDIDIIGDGGLSLSFDAEIIAVISDALTSLGLKDFTIKINNRKILSGLISSLGASSTAPVMRVVDKLDKISAEEFINGLMALGLTANNAEVLHRLCGNHFPADCWLDNLGQASNSPEFKEGLTQLAGVLNVAKMFGIKGIVVSPGLARGLDYYTGTVYEVVLHGRTDSICGGGRYNNLASSFTNKKLPGVGASIGISRLASAILMDNKQSTPAQLLITIQDSSVLEKYINISNLLRASGIKVELYLEDKNLSTQMKYAAKRGFRFAIIANAQELEDGKVMLRNLATGEQNSVNVADVGDILFKSRESSDR